MSGVFLDRSAGRLALYLNGDLQFDAADEAIYHEALAALPLSLAAVRAPDRPLRALVLGGGDGLALRELLKEPRLAEAVLVERDAEVLALAHGPLAALNARALSDPRARVVLGDAADALESARGFDVVVYDLTYPSDLAGAALLTTERFQQARRALTGRGILALNAVSPELTSDAFACLGATLEAAGLAATPYTFDLPSFRAEGYGRWGFFLASPERITRAELGWRSRAALVPRALSRRRRAPNLSGQELLGYVAGAEPLAWKPPFAEARFTPSLKPAPALTAASGFSRWLRAPAGRRTLDGLLRSLPVSRRGPLRESALDWGERCETLFSTVDMPALFSALERAERLPRAWSRELKTLRRRLAGTMPNARTLAREGYRVFALLMLVLLLANIMFPDNLYAKGYGSHHGGGGGGDITWSYSGSRASSFHHFGRSRYRVYDRDGKDYAVEPFRFSASPGGKALEALLALGPGMQLLDDGRVSYDLGLRQYRALVGPEDLRVVDAKGAEIAFMPTPYALWQDIQSRARNLTGPLDKAREDHTKWLAWVDYAGPLAAADREALPRLEAMREAAARADAMWQRVPTQASQLADIEIKAAKPPSLGAGVWLWQAASGAAGPVIAVLKPEGLRFRAMMPPPPSLLDEDRYYFALLARRAEMEKDASLAPTVAAWVAAFPDVGSPGARR